MPKMLRTSLTEVSSDNPKYLAKKLMADNAVDVISKICNAKDTNGFRRALDTAAIRWYDNDRMMLAQCEGSIETAKCLAANYTR
jgi:hypothetical protein